MTRREEPEGETLAAHTRPLGDNVVIELVNKPRESAGGIHIPQTAALPPQEGVVISVGPGGGICTVCGTGERRPMGLKPGDRVLFSHWAGSEVRSEGEALFIVSERDVLAIVGGTEVAP